jgi:hypothetical protein
METQFRRGAERRLGDERMAEVEQMLFTVGVFKDAMWAERGIEALTRKGFAPSAMSVLAKETPDVTAFVERLFGPSPDRIDLPAVGSAIVRGSLIDTLQGTAKDLGRVGVAAAMRRAGFQPHDGLIYETLASRGGILIALHGAPRAADALATMLSYGGGNAAIGAWTGRV